MRNITCFHIATVTPDWKPYDQQEFPPPIYHRPVALHSIRLNLSDVGRPPIKDSWSIQDIGEERDLLSRFFTALTSSVSDSNTYVVTFGGDAFVLPVLQYGTLRHGLTSPFLSVPLLTQRHEDLSEILGSFGKVKRFVSLSDYATLIGLNKRPFFDVAKAFEEGAISAIADRLELDVMLIMALYLRFLRSRGELTPDQWQAASKALLFTCCTESKFIQRYISKQEVKRYLQVGSDRDES